jgi:branched-subunit amino acid aminotransferase/4-amino-4-deoxychorismate lyase
MRSGILKETRKVKLRVKRPNNFPSHKKRLRRSCKAFDIVFVPSLELGIKRDLSTIIFNWILLPVVIK